MPRYEKVTFINPKIIEYAIRTSGYAIEIVANYIPVEQERLSSWMKGEDYPTFNQLVKIAEKTKRPIPFFFLDTPPDEKLPDDHRLFPGVTLGDYNPDLHLAIRFSNYLLNVAEEIAKLLEYQFQFKIPEFTSSTDPDKAASRIRKILKISIEQQFNWRKDEKYLEHWRKALFENGVLVLKYPFKNDTVRAFCIGSKNKAVICLSSSDAAPAMIFSVFHELCHLGLGISAVSGGSTIRKVNFPHYDIERYCDKFAEAFLMPLSEDKVQNELNSIQKVIFTKIKSFNEITKEIEDTAKRFKVSKYVVLNRLKAANQLSEYHFWELYDFFKKVDKDFKPPSGGSGKPYITEVLRRGTLFSSLIITALDQEKITPRDASNYLNLKTKWLENTREYVLSALYG